MTTENGNNQTETDPLDRLRQSRGVTTGGSERPLANIRTTSRPPAISEDYARRAEAFGRTSPEAQQERECRIAVARFDAAGVPKRHRMQAESIDLTAHDQWRSRSIKLADMLGTGFIVVLSGDRGRGKTQLAIDAIRLTTLDSRTARYATAMDFFINIKAGYAEKVSELESLSPFLTPDLLVIDEAHERGETEWEQRLLTYLIDCRYRAMQDTLLVTNQTQKDFLAAMGPSVASRIGETGGFMVCDWESFRVKPKGDEQ